MTGRETTAVRLDLISAVTGRDGLVRIGLSSGRARLDSRNTGLRGADGFFFRLTGLVQLVAEFVLGFLKFAHCLSHSPRQFRQFFCPEEDEDDQQDNDQIWSSQIHEAREQAHNKWLNIRLPEEVARKFAGAARGDTQRQDARWPHWRDARATAKERRQIAYRRHDEFQSRPGLRLENCDMRRAVGLPVSRRQRNRQRGAEIAVERSRRFARAEK